MKLSPMAEDYPKVTLRSDFFLIYNKSTPNFIGQIAPRNSE